jgi:hypothetical protein
MPGFTVKMLLSGGGYTYHSDGLRTDIDGAMISAAAMPGWRFTRDGVNIGIYAGPVVQEYRLSPFDPGSRLHGFYVGGQVSTDIWYQPSERTMATLNGTIASIGPTGSLRLAFGVRAFLPVFVGPEVQQIWCGEYEELRLGMHFTGLHAGPLEWSTGAGWAITSDSRQSPYVRFGFNARY